MATKLYNLAKLFSDNIWCNVTNVPQVKDFCYRLDKEYGKNVFTYFVLYSSEIMCDNMLLQFEEHKIENEIFYCVKFYQTKQDNLQILREAHASKFIDKKISMEILHDNVQVLYSENIDTEKIIQICEEIYKYIHEYMIGVRGCSQEKLNKISEELSNL